MTVAASHLGHVLEVPFDGQGRGFDGLQARAP